MDYFHNILGCLPCLNTTLLDPKRKRRSPPHQSCVSIPSWDFAHEGSRRVGEALDSIRITIIVSLTHYDMYIYIYNMYMYMYMYLYIYICNVGFSGHAWLPEGTLCKFGTWSIRKLLVEQKNNFRSMIISPVGVQQWILLQTTNNNVECNTTSERQIFNGTWGDRFSETVWWLA